MASFEAAGDQTIVRLEDYERDLLHQLLDEMKMLLEADIAADPVHQRLYPRAYEDPGAARAYQELVGDELKSGKLAAVRTVERSLEKDTAHGAALNAEERHAWLTTLTDLRLAIGTRLEVTEEKMSADLNPDNPEAPTMSVLHWLGWMQESMLESIDREER